MLLVGILVWHLTAIVIGALPPPESFDNFPARQPSPMGPVADGVTAGFDGLAHVVAPISKGIWWVTQPIHRAARWYRAVAGVGQQWAMFSNPPRAQQYLRVRYYIQPRRGSEWMATELVMPAHREDQIRLFQSYRDSYEDKAMAIALTSFYSRRKPAAIAPDTKPEQLPDDLAPIGRYFARRFEARSLAGTGARVVRTEVWVGSAPAPSMGETLDPAVRDARNTVLQAYYEGPVEQRFGVPPYPPYHGGEAEADIRWVLEYYEER